MADSLVELLHSDITNTTEIYFAARTVTANVGYYYSNSKSFDQLKAAGLLRYIKNKNLLDSIGNYYSSFQWLANQIDLLRLKLDEIHKGNTRLFHSYVFQQMMINIKIAAATAVGGQRTNIGKPLIKPALLSTDERDINTVSLNYHYYATTIKFSSVRMVMFDFPFSRFEIWALCTPIIYSPNWSFVKLLAILKALISSASNSIFNSRS